MPAAARPAEAVSGRRPRNAASAQSAAAAAAGSAHQDVEFDAQPNGHAGRCDQGPGLRVHEGAAAGGHDLRPFLQQPGNHLFLDIAKGLFAVKLEDVIDGTGGRLDDFFVGIDEGHVQFFCQFPPDTSFPGPHETD